MKHVILMTLSVVLLPLSRAHCSVVSADAIQLSTVSGQVNSNGVAISSPVYIVSSSLTLNGDGGTITSASSITASALFGDGSQMAGLPVLIATQTFFGSNAFTSSVTVQSGGRPIILSTSSSISNFSMSSAGVVTFFPSLHNSSSTTIPEYSTSITTFGPCITGSTLTLITTGGQIEARFVGSVFISSATGGNPPAAISLLQDGNFVRDLSATKSVLENYATFGMSFVRAVGISNFNYLIPAPTPGSHSYCLTIRTTNSSATVTLAGPSTLLTTMPLSGNLFYVQELK